MTTPVLLAGLWALSFVAVVGIVAGQVARDSRARRRAREYEASRDRAVQVRLAEDAEVAWLYSIPVMPFDPEKLGGAS